MNYLVNECVKSHNDLFLCHCRTATNGLSTLNRTSRLKLHMVRFKLLRTTVQLNGRIVKVVLLWNGFKFELDLECGTVRNQTGRLTQIGGICLLTNRFASSYRTVASVILCAHATHKCYCSNFSPHSYSADNMIPLSLSQFVRKLNNIINMFNTLFGPIITLFGVYLFSSFDYHNRLEINGFSNFVRFYPYNALCIWYVRARVTCKWNKL